MANYNCTVEANEFETKLRHRLVRSREGYRAFCATIDLLGVSQLLEQDPAEAMSRLNDLQLAFAHGTLIFPGDAQERACFAGDSWFFVREVAPDEDEPALWKAFCGRVFALVSIVAEMENDLGNPGLRVIISYGSLVQIIEPDNWREDFIEPQTRNWFVLTGAAEALRKSLCAEQAGKKAGFKEGYFWHESPTLPLKYLGTPLTKFDHSIFDQPTTYPAIYEELSIRTNYEVSLPPEFLAK